MLAAQLKQWFDEYRGISGCADVPEKLWAFMESRLQESGIVADDPNTVRMADGKRVKVTGGRQLGQQGYLVEWHAAGRMGFSPVKDFHPEDNAKLADILDRLEAA